MTSRKAQVENELLQAKYTRALSTLETFVGAAMLDMQRNSNPAIVAVAITNLMAKKYGNDTDFVRVIAALAISQLAIIRKNELEAKIPASSASDDTVDSDESTKTEDENENENEN